MSEPPIFWPNAVQLPSHSFTCGHCDKMVGGSSGFVAHATADRDLFRRIYICPFCRQPTYFDEEDRQVPGAAFGNRVDHLPVEVAALYQEARNCLSVASCTAAVLACRTLLMHVAVHLGAPEGQSFVAYVNFLVDDGFVPRNAHGWVDHIRRRGNDANHRIELMARSDAETLLTFTEMILKMVFEFPARIPPSSP